MRKLYSLMVMFIMAMVANAQVITFTSGDVAQKLNGKSYGTDGFVLTVVDDNADDTKQKTAIDGSNTYFGTIEEKTQFAYRIKSGSTSGDHVYYKLSIPKDGILNVCARSASSSETRTLIITQNGENVLEQALSDADAVTEDYTSGGEAKQRKIYPIYSCSVKAGEAIITYTGAVNIYALEMAAAPVEPVEGIVYGDNTYKIVATETLNLTELEAVSYSGNTADFSTQLAALVAAAGVEATTANFVQVDAEGKAFAFNTNDGWHSADGMVEGFGWGTEKGVCIKPWNGEAIDGTISYIGCFDETWTAGETHTMQYALLGDGVAAVLNVVIAFEASGIPPMDEPVTDLTQLTIVKELVGTLTLKEGKQYEGAKATIEVAELANFLGCSEESLVDNLKNVFFTQQFVTNEETGEAAFTNNLVAERGTTDGWFGRYSSYDEATGTETPIVQNALKTYGGGCTFYIQNPTFSEGEFGVTYGQYPGVLKAGDQDFAVVYIVNGNKAVKITYTVDVQGQESLPFEEMTKAGEQTISITADIDNNYTQKNFTIDMEALTEALGCEAEDLVDFYAFAAEGVLSDNHTETTGYYLNEEGYIATWGSSSAFFVALKSLANGEYGVGQMSGHFTNITEDVTCKTQFIYMYVDKYYVVNFEYIVKAPTQPDDDFEYKLVSTEILNKQIIPGTVEYNATEKTTIDIDYVVSQIGTADYVIYSDKAGADGTLAWSKNYTCTPAPGFWFGKSQYTNEEGQVVVDNAGWGNNAFGMTFSSNGTITWYEYPGACTSGEAYSANVYFVNEETGAYLKYIINVRYVDEIAPDAETVGTENVTVKAGDKNADDMYTVILDMAKAYEALDITEDELEAAQVVAPKSQFVFDTFDAEEDILFNANGYATSNEEEINAIANLQIIDGTPTLVVDPLDNDLTSDEPVAVVVRIGIEYNGKRYVHNVTLANEAYIAATAINGVQTSANAAAIYTVSGAKVNALQKGLNIMKMTDGTVKKVLVK